MTPDEKYAADLHTQLAALDACLAAMPHRQHRDEPYDGPTPDDEWVSGSEADHAASVYYGRR